MKVRRQKVFLYCIVCLCVVSFLHYYKAFFQVPLLHDLSAHYSTLISRDQVSRMGRLSISLWDFGVRIAKDGPKDLGDVKQHPNPGNPFHVENGNIGINQLLDPTGPEGGIHKRTFQLRDESKTYFVETKSGAFCFQEGTQLIDIKHQSVEREMGVGLQQVVALTKEVNDKKPNEGKSVAECICRAGWHGPSCGIPTIVQHSNLVTKSQLLPRKTPRRVINAININHEFDLLHARFHELADAVDLFLVCESNYTAYGAARPLYFLERLLGGAFDYMRHKLLYVFLDHFPEGGRQNGWIADDYLRTFLTRDGMARVRGSRPDDVFVINDADEIPTRDALLFLKLFDGWTEPFSIHMRKSLYGFFWKQSGTLDVLSGCTVATFLALYRSNGITLRRTEYFKIPDFRKYEKESGRIFLHWSVGSQVHYAGWHCSWCFRPEGIYYKLISAQNGDFPRWGDFAEKRNLSYIRELIRNGYWFDDHKQAIPRANPKEHMFAPKYFMDRYEQYRYLLENPYAKEKIVPLKLV